MLDRSARGEATRAAPARAKRSGFGGMIASADGQRDPTPSIRMLSFPDSDRNPYLRLFYDALRPYGVRVAHVGRVHDGMLRDPGRSFDAIHFHWSIERIWRWRRCSSAASVAMGLVGWHRFLREAHRARVGVI